jgi:hypothetical protein
MLCIVKKEMTFWSSFLTVHSSLLVFTFGVHGHPSILLDILVDYQSAVKALDGNKLLSQILSKDK